MKTNILADLVRGDRGKRISIQVDGKTVREYWTDEDLCPKATHPQQCVYMVGHDGGCLFGVVDPWGTDQPRVIPPHLEDGKYGADE